MVQHKIYFVIKTFFITYLSLLIMSCDLLKENHKHKNLLLITAESSEVLNHDEYNKQLKIISTNIKQENLYYILSEVLFIPNARNSVISINKNSHKNFYGAVIIYDDVLDDDSVSGYRYDIKMHRTESEAWEFIEIRQSWRCWEDRGHRAFSLLPCS